MTILGGCACIHAVACMNLYWCIWGDAYGDILCVDQATVYPAAVTPNDSQLNNPVGWGTPPYRSHQHRWNPKTSEAMQATVCIQDAITPA